ncbi:MAG TPA: cell envelope integrity protein CreD [Ignavibacteria bacterium]|nr:cell envelope integrity protein CreD [Ignavibacteria bacterium]
MENQDSGGSHFVRTFANSLAFKIIVIVGLIFFLLIPSAFIGSLIEERQEVKDAAFTEVSSNWGGKQNIGGPVLYIPYVKTIKDTNGKINTYEDIVKILPLNLSIDGKVDSELRNRGIYKFTLYTTHNKVTGKFDLSHIPDIDTNNTRLKWNEAYVLFGISDMKGIKDNIRLKWNDMQTQFSAGLISADVFDAGVSSSVNVIPFEINNFEIDLTLNGSESLTFLPLGKETNVNITSNWGDPSFTGNFLPEERKITDTSFEASWKVLDLNRNYQQSWIRKNNKVEIASSAFGLNFFVPLNGYTEVMRAVKYVLMFIGLTFIIFFFVEYLGKKRIHPIQYTLVGFSLVVFYLLLLSISEHLQFNLAYLISSASIILLIGLYSLSVLKSKKFAFFISLALTALYGFLYILLLNEDYSLLIGSIGIFVVLAVIMYFLRNINWYKANRLQQA